jgi:DNA-directed RNA polymerase specialized sigma24 family protein
VARKAGLTDAEADEVVQETLIAVAKKIESVPTSQILE